MDNRTAQFIDGVNRLRDDLDAEHQWLCDLIAQDAETYAERATLARVVRELDTLLDNLKNG